jgi:hypothetical protein
MVEQTGDMILAQVPLTLMIIMAFSMINTGKVIVVLDLVTGMQYKMWVCKIEVPIEAHISAEVITMIEVSISNTVVSVIPTVDSSINIVDSSTTIVDSSTNVMHSRRMVDKEKKGVCNFI